MNGDLRENVEALCREMCRRYAVISIDRLAGGGDLQEVIYEVTLKKDTTYEAFVQRLTALSTTVSVNLLVGEGSVNV